MARVRGARLVSVLLAIVSNSDLFRASCSLFPLFLEKASKNVQPREVSKQEILIYKNTTTLPLSPAAGHKSTRR